MSTRRSVSLILSASFFTAESILASPDKVQKG
jgi:hypothetical protein